ncbi:hypothetical protein CN376_22845 [Bacillus cereus]|uniref:hypothetical protein n=1 Tax=Bacillus cereus TaxID=1396 RepID=UPI000BF6F684|nr:hypothetical protein [Bacillus cereus]PEZ87921.1 hypothetical protein CN376_22845 [Bacillus cereus]PFR12639.1 hypothetical protein COK30_13915 [Bacillus cereus]
MSLLKIHLDRQSPKDKPKKKAYKNGLRFYSEKEAMMFRSTWEVELAELLTSLGIIYEYEPQRFYYKDHCESYLPDYYLPEYDTFIEVKGYMDKRSLKRCNLFRKYQGATYGFLLYEKEERELVLNEPALIYTYLGIAQEELRRRQDEKVL